MIQDPQSRRGSIMDASRRSSFLEVPLTDAQRRKRRGSAQIPTGAIMDKKSREKLMKFVFKDDPEFLQVSYEFNQIISSDQIVNPVRGFKNS